MMVLRVSEVERVEGGINRPRLIQYYLEQIEDDIEDLQQLEEEKQLIDKVLKRLVKEQYLMEVRGDISQETTAEESAQGSEQAAKTDQVLIMLHPRCDVETLFDQ